VEALCWRGDLAGTCIPHPLHLNPALLRSGANQSPSERSGAASGGGSKIKCMSVSEAGAESSRRNANEAVSESPVNGGKS